MANNLYNILVPVDFTSKTKCAILKAIEISNNFNCNIHLVHVANEKPMFRNSGDAAMALKKLEFIKSTYQTQLCGEGSIEISVLNGSRREQLTDYIRRFEMDLVVTGLSRFNFLHRIISSVSISRLAKNTNIPILATRPGGLVCHFKKIVLPVSGQLPMRQIKFAALLGRAFKSRVYFVSLRLHANDQHQNIIDSALEMVQSISTIPAQCFLLEGKNLAKSTLEFSKKINADLILVNPLKDFRLPGFWNRITNKLLSYGSNKIPVVTVPNSHD